MEYQPLEIKEFHGGITENFIDGALQQYEKADNFLITVNRKLYTRPGSTIYDATNFQIPAGAQRISALIDHYGDLLTASAKKLYYYNAGAWATLTGPTGNDVFTAGSTTSRISWSDWNNHTFLTNNDYAPPVKIYRDQAGDLQVNSAGMPALASSPSLAGGGSGSNSYIYAFLYSVTYNVGTVEFLDQGPITQVQLSGVDTPDGTTVNITSIPVFANGSTYNYDTTNMKVRIYRTQANGTTFNFVTELSNGTTSYNDSAGDSSIVNNASIYTDGGESENNTPPLCRCLHVTDTLAFYGNIKNSSGEEIKNRVYQSKPSDPDSVPDNFFVDLDDNVVGISSQGQTPIVFCEKSIYRLDGFFDSLGAGLLQAQEIESTVGCISLNSIVQVQRGVVFAGETGFYFTDGWEVRKLSNNFNDTYRDFTLTTEQQERIYGTFDRKEKRVWWSVQENGETEVNKCYILDTRYGLGVAQSDLEYVQSAFTTASNGDDFRPTALLFFENELLRADSRGYTFKHNLDYTSDPRINTLVNPSLWADKTIIWDYKSIAMSFGTTLKRKFVPRVTFNAENDTNITVRLKSINDLGRQTKDIKEVRFRKNWVWGDPVKVWGTDNEIWNFKGIIEEERRFPSDSLRCSYKQVQLTNAFTIILTSDDLTTATVDDSAKTLTLDDISTYDWPTDCVGQFLYFEDDQYIEAFEITARTNDVLTYSDINNKILGGSKKWVIRGFPKNELINLVSLSLWYAYLGNPADFASASLGSTPQ